MSEVLAKKEVKSMTTVMNKDVEVANKDYSDDVSENNRQLEYYQVLAIMSRLEMPDKKEFEENRAIINIICVGKEGLESFLKDLETSGKAEKVIRDEEGSIVKIIGPVSVHDAGYTKRRIVYTPFRLADEYVYIQ